MILYFCRFFYLALHFAVNIFREWHLGIFFIERFKQPGLVCAPAFQYLADLVKQLLLGTDAILKRLECMYKTCHASLNLRPTLPAARLAVSSNMLPANWSF